jgi:hypothetical protein
MVRVLAPTGYKVVARLIRAPKAGSPLIVIPIAPSVPSCSELSRCGLATAEHARRLVRRPTLTAPARAGISEVRVGTKKRALGRTKKLTEKKDAPCRLLKLLLDKAPYKETAGTGRRSCSGLYGDLSAADEAREDSRRD